MSSGEMVSGGSLLSAVLPALVQELRELLVRHGREEFVPQIDELRIIERCRCGDDFCATTYTAERPEDPRGQGLRSLELRPAEGMIILDILHGRIITVEVLYRPEVRERLVAVLP